MMQETNGYDHHAEEEELFTDAIDHDILMHRDAHFGGDFDVMLKYYEADNVGVDEEFEYERIAYLAQVEKELGQNLAPLILTGPEMERIARAREAYRHFKAIYNVQDERNRFPRLIADLLLSEEMDPEKEIDAVVKEGSAIVPELLAIVNSSDAYDPLFPGYGYAPYLAILTLGKIGDERVLIPLFEALGKETFFGDEVIVDALLDIGEKAKHFLLKILKSRPLTQDNVNAALALSAFPLDEEIGAAVKQELADASVKKNPLLSSYLELQSPEH